jgi:hypothetical protein
MVDLDAAFSIASGTPGGGAVKMLDLGSDESTGRVAKRFLKRQSPEKQGVASGSRDCDIGALKDSLRSP